MKNWEPAGAPVTSKLVTIATTSGAGASQDDTLQ